MVAASSRSVAAASIAAAEGASEDCSTVVSASACAVGGAAGGAAGDAVPAVEVRARAAAREPAAVGVRRRAAGRVLAGAATSEAWPVPVGSTVAGSRSAAGVPASVLMEASLHPRVNLGARQPYCASTRSGVKPAAV